MEVSEKRPSSNDTLLDNLKRNTSPRKGLRSARLLSTPTTARLSFRYGILLGRRSSVGWGRGTILAPMPLFSCLTSRQELRIRMCLNGTRIWLVFVTTFQSCWLGIRLIKRTERSKPDKSLSIEREIFNILMSQPNQIINMKNHSCGFWELWLETPTCIWLRLLLWSQSISRWIKTKFNNWLMSGKRSRTIHFPMRRMRISSDLIIDVFIYIHFKFISIELFITFICYQK